MDTNSTSEWEFSCTFCGPGTWSTWQVVTDDGVVFACDRHHAELSEAEMIRWERMRSKNIWKKVPDPRGIRSGEE